MLCEPTARNCERMQSGSWFLIKRPSRSLPRDQAKQLHTVVPYQIKRILPPRSPDHLRSTKPSDGARAALPLPIQPRPTTSCLSLVPLRPDSLVRAHSAPERLRLFPCGLGFNQSTLRARTTLACEDQTISRSVLRIQLGKDWASCDKSRQSTPLMESTRRPSQCVVCNCVERPHVGFCRSVP